MSAIVSMRSGQWMAVSAMLPGRQPETIGVLLRDPETDTLYLRFRRDFDHWAGEEAEVLEELAADLELKSRYDGAAKVLDWLEEHCSNLIQVSDRESIPVANFDSHLLRLYRQHVKAEVLQFRTHVPFTTLRAAAGGLSGEHTVEAEDWYELPTGVRVGKEYFVARIEGRSMEPKIPDGSLCLFKYGVTGSRDGRLLVIRHKTNLDGSGEFTIKRYRSQKNISEDGWEHQRITLEPLNPEFQPWDLSPDEFDVIAEFVKILE